MNTTVLICGEILFVTYALSGVAIVVAMLTTSVAPIRVSSCPKPVVSAATEPGNTVNSEALCVIRLDVLNSTDSDGIVSVLFLTFSSFVSALTIIFSNVKLTLVIIATMTRRLCDGIKSIRPTIMNMRNVMKTYCSISLGSCDSS